MNAEVMPESNNPDKNLPKPEIRGDVESGDDNLDEEEKDGTNNFNEREIEKIVDNELETFDEIKLK